ncbi:Uncharacterised protein [Kingella potus]|uniref:Uncharacterized protein n=1 Tax=Kingella potus TaxID=265175 RepID=A0A377R1H1_9NEIS|nr:Uncharacterised protein [Kingella potus]
MKCGRNYTDKAAYVKSSLPPPFSDGLKGQV